MISGFENDLASATLSVVQKRKKAFYLAQSYYYSAKYDQAAIHYSEYLKISPRGAFVSQSQLHLGDCFKELGDKQTAKIYYTELVNKPGAKANFVNKAKSRLAKL